jgi:hypothetical protein
MTKKILILLLTPFLVYAGNFTVAFIGLTPGGAPSFEESFNRDLQEKLSINQDVNTLDYATIQRLRGKLDFQNVSVVSPQLLSSLHSFCPDSTVFVWGTIENYSVRNAWLGLLHTQVKAEATMRIMVCSQTERPYAGSSAMVCTVAKPTGWFLIHPFTASSKVSAMDLAAAIGLLEKEAVDVSFKLVSSIIKNEIQNPRRNQRTAGAKNSPNISDLFSVPSVEAASVDGTNASDSTAVPPVSPVAATDTSKSGSRSGAANVKK